MWCWDKALLMTHSHQIIQLPYFYVFIIDILLVILKLFTMIHPGGYFFYFRQLKKNMVEPTMHQFIISIFICLPIIWEVFTTRFS